MNPLDISEEDELERISTLLQRDNLVRGLGIVEHVYRMLHCTPGTIGGTRPPNAGNPWQRNRMNTKKYGPDIEADRRFITRNTGAESAQPLNRHNSMNEASRRPYGITHTAPVFDTFSANGTGLQAAAAIPGRVQPASSHHLSVVSAPAPVIHRPEFSVNRKLSALDTTFKTRQPNRRTVKLKSINPNPNALVYS